MPPQADNNNAQARINSRSIAGRNYTNGVSAYTVFGLSVAGLTLIAGWVAAGEARNLRTGLRVMAGSVVSGVVGTVACYMMGSIAGGLVLGAAVAGIVVVRERRVGTFVRLLAGVGQRDDAPATLLEWLDDAMPEHADAGEIATWARYVCAAAEALLHHDYIDEAERALSLLATDIADPIAVASRAQYLAVIHIRRGELSHARTVLASAPGRIPDPLMSLGVSATDALLLALEGSPEKALSRSSELQEETDHPSIHRLLLSASAHALAQTNPDGAKNLLEEATHEHGTTILERIRRDDGPASPLANAMLQEHVGPYR